MKITEEQKNKLTTLLSDSGTGEEIADFLSQQDAIKQRKKLEEMVQGIISGNQAVGNEIQKTNELLNRVVSALGENSKFVSSKVGGAFDKVAGLLVGKLEELGKSIPKQENISPALLALSTKFSEMKDTFSMCMALILSEMKRIKRIDGGGGGTSFNFVRLDGAVDGNNTVFTIPSSQVIPRSDAIVLVWNSGQFQQSVEGDWTRNGGTFTFTFAPAQTPAVLYEK